MAAKSWASAVGSRSLEVVKPAAEPTPAAPNGLSTSESKEDIRLQRGAVAGGEEAASGAPALSYEPMPNEIRRVTLHKPDASAKLGIRLAGDDRPRIVSLNLEAIAAKTGGLAVNDVILTVNGQKAQGHAGTTQMLKTAVGPIKVELFTLKLSPEAAGGGEVTEADIAQQVAATERAAAVATATATAGQASTVVVASTLNGAVEEQTATAHVSRRPNPWSSKAQAAPPAVPLSAGTDGLGPAGAPALMPAEAPAAMPADAPAPEPTPPDVSAETSGLAPESSHAPAPAPAALRMPAWQNPKATAAAVGAPAPQATAAVPASAGEAGEAGDSTAASGSAAARRGGPSREAWNGANSTAGATSAVFATCDSKAAAPSSEAPDRPSLIADTERICSDCGKAFNVCHPA